VWDCHENKPLKVMKTHHQHKAWLATVLCAAVTGTAVAQSGTYPAALPDTANPTEQADRDRDRVTTPAQPTDFNKASKLIGMEVRNAQGEKLGDIKDIVIDFDQGKVSYAVLGVGGVIGIGEKHLAVPLKAFSRSASQSALMLNADKASVTRAEGMGSDWPAVQNPSFGAMPFWQEEGSQKHSDDSKPHLNP
jgi:hypothetical protein